MSQAPFAVRAQSASGLDLVSLGEVMLRLDPGEGRIRTARSFRAWEGGGEYNVARGLRRCFGMNTAIVTALADNEVGRLIEDLMLQGGVDTRYVQWRPYDGCGRATRNGLNFTERGFGIRGAVGVSDRGHTAAGQLEAGDVDWDEIFGATGARWLHCGGIYAGLSESTPDVIEEAMVAARKHGAVISYDLNYRPSLWKGIGGIVRAQEVNRRLATYVDVMIGNEEDFTAALGFEVPHTSSRLDSIEAENFASMVVDVSRAFPNLSVIATTLRVVTTASKNDWSALAWVDGQVISSAHRPGLDILDRIGGGDSFASGLIFGLLEGYDVATALEYGAAHGALAMTTPGDTSMATLAEVRSLMSGGGARVQR
jgi:2-dehydro-3-deoxygluconokinase